MIFIKQTERGRWEFMQAEVNYDGRVVLGRFLGDCRRVADLPEMFAALIAEEVVDFHESGIDRDSGLPAEGVAADAGEVYLMPGGPPCDDECLADAVVYEERWVTAPVAQNAPPQGVPRKLLQRDLELPF